MTIKLLSVEETLAAAALACGRANRPPALLLGKKPCKIESYPTKPRGG